MAQAVRAADTGRVPRAVEITPDGTIRIVPVEQAQPVKPVAVKTRDRALIDDMPRPRLPDLHRERTRHGAVIWYGRMGHGPRIRIRAPYGSPEFKAEYEAAITGEPATPVRRRRMATLEWL